jgi:hypothetical protein
MNKSLKRLQFIGFIFLVYLVLRAMSLSVIQLVIKYWSDTTIFSIVFWLIVTVLYLIVGTAVFGFLLLLIRKINPYKEQKISARVLIPLFVLMTVLQSVDLYDVLRNYGLYWNNISYIPAAFLFFIMIYMGVKMYSMLTKTLYY